MTDFQFQILKENQNLLSVFLAKNLLDNYY
jgi:hypothetical protein